MDLSELKTSYDIDFFQDGQSGFLLISHIIFSKLPGILQKELIGRVGNNYPAIKQIFENCSDIIKTLVKMNLNKKLESFHTLKNFRPLEKRNKSVTDPAPVSTLENFAMNANKNTPNCKLCNSDGHKIRYYSKYPDVKSRKARCRELNLCILCSST